MKIHRNQVEMQSSVDEPFSVFLVWPFEILSHDWTEPSEQIGGHFKGYFGYNLSEEKVVNISHKILEYYDAADENEKVISNDVISRLFVQLEQCVQLN